VSEWCIGDSRRPEGEQKVNRLVFAERAGRRRREARANDADGPARGQVPQGVRETTEVVRGGPFWEASPSPRRLDDWSERAARSVGTCDGPWYGLAQGQSGRAARWCCIPETMRTGSEMARRRRAGKASGERH
jgi:hypothetical protein